MAAVVVAQSQFRDGTILSTVGYEDASKGGTVAAVSQASAGPARLGVRPVAAPPVSRPRAHCSQPRGPARLPLALGAAHPRALCRAGT